MIEVKLLDKMPNEVIDIVYEIRLKGYVLGVDFDYAYHPPKYTDLSYDPEYDRYTIFRFHKEEIATWFELLYK